MSVNRINKLQYIQIKIYQTANEIKNLNVYVITSKTKQEKRVIYNWAPSHTPVFSATQAVEAGGSQLQGQPQQLSGTSSQNSTKAVDVAQWQSTQGSIPSTIHTHTKSKLQNVYNIIYFPQYRLKYVQKFSIQTKPYTNNRHISLY